MRNSRACLAGLLAGLIVLLAAAPPSRAVDVSIRSCSQSPTAGFTAAGKGWYSPTLQSNAAGSAIGSCPAGLTFETTKSAAYGTTGAWSYNFAALPSAIHLRLDYEGGETTGGWSYTVNDCAATCKLLATFPARAADDPPAVFDLDLVKPTLLKITVKCEALLCAASQPLKFHDVVAAVRDETPPKASVITNAGYWIDPRDVTASATISDAGGMGLSTSVASIDGGTGFFGRNACDYNFYFGGTEFLPPDSMCEQSISMKTQRLDLKGVPDGTHNIVIDAVDAAGNVMPTFKSQIRLDGTPPNTPEDVVLSGVNEFGWTQQDAVGARWTNSGEEAQTADQSGIWLPRFERKPYPGFSGDSVVTEGIFDVDTAKTIKSIPLPTDGKWNVYISVTDRAKNTSGAVKVTVGRDRGVPAPPEFGEGLWLSQAALNDLKLPVTQPQGGEISGICGYAVLVDRDADAAAGTEISQRGSLGHLLVDDDTPQGVNWLHARAISCAGVASANASTQVKIDRTPPRVFVDGVPSSEWTNKPIKARVSADDALSGVASVSYSIDEEPGQTVPGDSAEFTPPRGRHMLSFSATDNAGNLSLPTTREIRFDDMAPEAELSVSDPANPTALSAVVRDRLSGVASALFEYRSVGSGEPWTLLATATHEDDAQPAATRVNATIPDAELEAGQYEFRLKVADHAGNSAVATAGALTLPLRAAPKLLAGLATVAPCKSRGSCAPAASRIDRRHAKSARTIGFADSVAVIGELRDARGKALVGADLKVYAAVGGRNREFVKNVTTDSNGRYAYVPPRGPSRRFTVSYAGSGQILPATATADLGVSVGAVLDVSRSTVRNGRTVIFSGRLLGVSRKYSAKGLRVVIKYYKPGSGWKPAVDDPVVDPDGKFVAEPYRFAGGLTSPVSVKFKAFINTRRTGFPYVEGYTNTRRVRVMP